MTSHDLEHTLAAVFSRVPRGIKFGVERTRAACERVGRPDRAFPVLHVAGTNGKGSVSSQCEAILRHAGYRTGLFTSPHLCRFAERIRIDGEPIEDTLLPSILGTALALDEELTFFETAFVAAMLAFREAGVQVAVLEVGLGGRLDATNVVERPVVTSITRVAFDHMKQLGDTLELIAWEKAGIAKAGVPMVLGPLDASADSVARDHAHASGAHPILGVGREIRIRHDDASTGAVEVPGCERSIRLASSLRGVHQLENAAVAAAMCVLARDTLARIAIEDIEAGIATTTWAARLESISDGKGEVLLDAAHNPDGIDSLVRFLAQRDPPTHAASRTALVFGAMEDKQWPSMLRRLGTVAQERFYVEPPGRKAASLSELARTLPGKPEPDIGAALADARAAVGASGLVVVAGSIFLAGQARALLLGLPRDPAVAL